MGKSAWQNIRINPAVKRDLQKAKRITKRPIATILDEAIDEKLTRIAQDHPNFKRKAPSTTGRTAKAA